MLCPACSKEVPADSRFCSDCGSSLDSTSAATRTSVGSSPTPSPAPTLDEARFLPGTIVHERYRIIGLLGRGGMGEVYRADDLKLGQPVALKFLPVELADNPDRLHRFLNEVKIARQVAHPNVCRVYDVGETDGHHYLSMEYVDGEDLATLLRRIGRLPEDKAVQIARQLCAGLAAAHELGILHRDIKPANVMLDGRGRAKLTDFGLAGLAEGFRGAELRAGTPTYMAPEQLSGKEVSVRSDIYSLGLVLYELFTGKRAFDAGSVVELTRKQLETLPTSPSSFMTAFDPVVERVLLRCLDKDPARRPATALAVAAALPGGDPLAAALAAGETPSPEMVAAAGPQGGLRPGVATACLVSVMLIWVLSWFPGRALNAFDHLPMRKSYAALKENARDIAARLGYEEAPKYTWAGFGFDFPEFAALIRDHGVRGLTEKISLPGQSVFWMDYRQDTSPIVPLGLTGRVSWNSPPASQGEVAMEVDLLGRLNVLRATPRRKEPRKDAAADDVDAAAPAAAPRTTDDGAARPRAGSEETVDDGASAGATDDGAAVAGAVNAGAVNPPPADDGASGGGAGDSADVNAGATHAAAAAAAAAEPDWALVFQLAGLDITKFQPATPTVRPASFADTRRAWIGTIPDYADRPVRVEGASLDGKPVYFDKIISSDPLWTTESGQPQPQAGTGLLIAAVVLLLVVGLLVIAGAVWLAVRNLKLGRGDRKGAFRVAAFVFAMRLLNWGLAGDHVGHPVELIPLAIAVCGATTLAVLAWIIYVACEPHVRRLWPEALVGWSRVLVARFGDPLVGRDVLIGCTFGAISILIFVILGWIASTFGVMGLLPPQQQAIALRGGRYAVGQLFSSFMAAMAVALVILMLFLLLRMLVRKTVVAAVLMSAVWGSFTALQFIAIYNNAGAGVFGFVLQAASIAVLAVVLVRFGLLALVVSILFSSLSNISLFTFDTSAPFFGVGLFVAVVAFALAAYGWKTALAGRPLLQDGLLES